MVSIRSAGPADLPWLSERDRHVDPDELDTVVRRERVLIVEVDGRSAGWLRWGKFWDEIPFMNMLFVDRGEAASSLSLVQQASAKP